MTQVLMFKNKHCLRSTLNSLSDTCVDYYRTQSGMHNECYKAVYHSEPNRNSTKTNQQGSV